METSEAQPGDVRLDDHGNVELFDGSTWTVVSSIFDEAGNGIRTDPEPRHSRDYAD